MRYFFVVYAFWVGTIDGSGNLFSDVAVAEALPLILWSDAAGKAVQEKYPGNDVKIVITNFIEITKEDFEHNTK